MESARNLRLVAVLAALLVVLVGVWVATRPKQREPVQKVTQVSLTKGEVSITLTREGAMMVRTPEGLFEQQWDQERVRAFFARFESEDFSQFEQYQETNTGYILRIVGEDGTERTVYFPFLGIPLPDPVRDLVEILEEVTSGEGLPSPTPFPTTSFQPTQPPVPTATPTTGGRPAASPTPIPRVGGGGGGGDPRLPFVCEFLDPEIWPNILSEVVCTPQ